MTELANLVEREKSPLYYGSNHTTTGSISLPENAMKYIRHPDPNKDLPFYSQSALAKIGTALSTITVVYPLAKMEVIPNGQIGLATWGSEFIFLKPGRIILIHPTQHFIGTVPENQQLIQHGNYIRVRVLDGQYGYGVNTKTGDPMILTPGTHIIDDPTFKWINFLDLSNNEIKCGTFTFIRVETGKIGLAFINSKLHVLEPNIHLLKSPDRFHCFVSTQQQIITLKHSVESADYIAIDISADIFYYLLDAEKAFTKAYCNVEDMTNSIKETAAATISMIVRASTFSEIGRSNPASSFPQSEIPSINPPTYESYQKRLHDEFVDKVQEFMKEKYGIFIENIRIKSLSIHDKKLADEVAAPAIIYAQTQAKLANVKSQTEIQTAEANRDAEIKKISANTLAYTLMKDAESKTQAQLANVKSQTEIQTAEAHRNADVKKISADATAYALVKEAEGRSKTTELETSAKAKQIIELAKAEAESKSKSMELETAAKARQIIELAKANADAIMITAKAEKDRLELEGQGHHTFALSVGATELGSQLAMARLQTSAVQGVTKIVYAPTSALPAIMLTNLNNNN